MTERTQKKKNGTNEIKMKKMEKRQQNEDE